MFSIRCRLSLTRADNLAAFSKTMLSLLQVLKLLANDAAVKNQTELRYSSFSCPAHVNKLKVVDLSNFSRLIRWAYAFRQTVQNVKNWLSDI
jgi:hypothetical protein